MKLNLFQVCSSTLSLQSTALKRSKMSMSAGSLQTVAPISKLLNLTTAPGIGCEMLIGTLPVVFLINPRRVDRADYDGGRDFGCSWGIRSVNLAAGFPGYDNYGFRQRNCAPMSVKNNESRRNLLCTEIELTGLALLWKPISDEFTVLFRDLSSISSRACSSIVNSHTLKRSSNKQPNVQKNGYDLSALATVSVGLTSITSISPFSLCCFGVSVFWVQFGLPLACSGQCLFLITE